ncbi:hypothetical protein [Kitasatospora sp. LaBMicrA B282]|uniref:hypothetical protein n=1 Tax=Kitasatospora sp. LaBMicrA B282 TaxID=3420949 RepID=UPI003D0FF454
MRTTTLAARGMIGLAVVGVFAVTGCGPDDTTTTTTTANSPAKPSAVASAPSAPSKPSDRPTAGGGGMSAAPSDSSSAPADTTGGDTGGAGVNAKPGTTIKIGQTADIPFTSGSTKGTIALTVTSIDAGNPADLAPLNLGDQVAGKVPYYIHYTIKNIGNTDLSFTTVDHMTGLLPDGTQAQDVYLISPFDKCPDATLPSGFTNGKTKTACSLELAPSASTKVTGAKYWDDPFSLLDNQGLVWK